MSSVPQLISDGTNDYIYGPTGTPIEQIQKTTGTPTYLYSDQLGSVIMEANSSGNVVATQSYSPYGTLASSTGTDPTPFGFAGGYTDPTGLIYLINRYYDPVTGQFMSVDPANSKTLQPYAYAGDNPINNVDPTGRSTLYRYTTGVCVSFIAYFWHWGHYHSICHILHTRNGESGNINVNPAPGFTAYGISVSGLGLTSNACSMHQLRGAFEGFEASVSVVEGGFWSVGRVWVLIEGVSLGIPIGFQSGFTNTPGATSGSASCC